MAKTKHVVPKSTGGWDVKNGGSSRATKHFETKKSAVDYARELAKKQEAELVVHNKDGKISQKDSHGNDPCPPKDKS
jgi:uncharacterized protein YdaT